MLFLILFSDLSLCFCLTDCKCHFHLSHLQPANFSISVCSPGCELFILFFGLLTSHTLSLSISLLVIHLVYLIYYLLTSLVCLPGCEYCFSTSFIVCWPLTFVFVFAQHVNFLSLAIHLLLSDFSWSLLTRLWVLPFICPVLCLLTFLLLSLLASVWVLSFIISFTACWLLLVERA